MFLEGSKGMPAGVKIENDDVGFKKGKGKRIKWHKKGGLSALKTPLFNL